MYNNFFIHTSANGHLGYFHVLAIVNSAAMNIVVHMFFSVLVFLVCMPVVGFLGCMAALFPGFFFSFFYYYIYIFLFVENFVIH